MKLLFEASARDNEPLTPVVDIKVNEGRTVLAFEDGTIRDRSTRHVWNSLLRPHGRSQKVVIVPAMRQRISWDAKNAQEFDVESAKSYRGQLVRELSLYNEGLSALESEVTGSRAKGIKVQFAKLQDMELKLRDLEDSRKMSAALSADLKALDWALSHVGKQEKARMPVLIPERAGKAIEVYGVPSVADIEQLRGRWDRLQKRSNRPFEDLFIQAPAEAVELVEGKIVVKAMTAEVAAPLVQWFRVVKSGPMVPATRSLWAWMEMCVAWNSLHIGKPLPMPKGLLVPAVARPSGAERTRKTVQKQSSTVDSLRKAVDELARALAASQASTVPLKEERDPVWWASWLEPGGWMVNLGAHFARLPGVLPDTRFSFFLMKDKKPMTWEFFESHTTTRWTPATKASHEYLSQLVAELYVLWDGETLNRYLGAWWTGKTSPANSLAAASVPFVSGVEGELKNPLIYSKSGEMGLWPACVFASGVSSASAKKFLVCRGLSIEQALEGFGKSGGDAWPLDDLLKDEGTLAAEIVALKQAAMQQESDERSRAGEWVALLARIRDYSLHSSAFEKAAWSLVRTEAEEASHSELPWTEDELERRHASALSIFVEEPSEDEGDQVEDLYFGDAQEGAVDDDLPSADYARRAGENFRFDDAVPMTVELNGLTYHILEPSATELPTPQGRPVVGDPTRICVSSPAFIASAEEEHKNHRDYAQGKAP
jgi:hypothetical protein